VRQQLFETLAIYAKRSHVAPHNVFTHLVLLLDDNWSLARPNLVITR
jgi:hypothetical protein